jgi:hypothetical protein
MSLKVISSPKLYVLKICLLEQQQVFMNVSYIILASAVSLKMISEMIFYKETIP